MARPKKPKTGYMEGYPKLAFYIGPSCKVRLPRGARSWRTNQIDLNAEDLAVLVAFTDRSTGYLDYPENQFKYTRYNNPFSLYYIVPVSAIASEDIPVTSIYNWKTSYTCLPMFDTKYFKIIENGKEPTTPVTAV